MGNILEHLPVQAWLETPQRAQSIPSSCEFYLNYSEPHVLTSTLRRVCARRPSDINKTGAPPCRSSTHSRGQRTWPTERSSWNIAKISCRRHPIPHAESYISPGNPATLAPNTRRSFLHFHDPAGPLSLRSKLQCFTPCCLHTNKSPEDATPQSSTSPAPKSEHPTTATYSDQHCDSVTFATYVLPCKN